MHRQVSLVLAFVAVCSSVSSAELNTKDSTANEGTNLFINSPEFAELRELMREADEEFSKIGINISPGYLEIQKWIEDTYGGFTWEYLGQYQRAVGSAPADLKKTPRDWDNFAKLDINDCSYEMMELMNSTVTNADINWFRTTITSRSPPHPIQEWLLKIVREFSDKCSMSYVAETINNIRVADERKIMKFIETLGKSAYAKCNKRGRLNLEGGSLVPWNHWNEEYHECVERRASDIMGHAIKEADNGWAAMRFSADEKVKRRLDTCEQFVNLINTDNLYKRIRFAVPFNLWSKFDEEFNVAWTNWEVCRRILGMKSLLVDSDSKKPSRSMRSLCLGGKKCDAE